MVIQSGAQCEILSTICADEMGEVYRARDPKAFVRNLLDAMKNSQLLSGYATKELYR